MRRSVGEGRETSERADPVLALGLGHGPGEATQDRRSGLVAPLVEDVLDAEPQVPEIEVVHVGELGHRTRVGGREGELHGLAVGFVEAVRPAGHLEAGSQALDIPLEWARERLVEVIDVEHQ